MYKSIHLKADSLQQSVRQLFDFMVSIGWTITDDIGTDEKVLSSPGENGEFGSVMYVKLYVDIASPNNIVLDIFGNYDPITHTGYDILYSGNAITRVFSTVNEVDRYTNVYMAGDKDWVLYSITNYSITGELVWQERLFFGCVSQSIHKIKHLCSTNIDIGTNVVIQLDSVDNLYIGNSYQLIDTERKLGINRVKILDIDRDNLTVTLDEVTINFVNGAYIGLHSFPMVLSSDGNLFALYGSSKTGPTMNIQSIYPVSPMSASNTGYTSPSATYISNIKNILSNVFIVDQTFGGIIGRFSDNLKNNHLTTNTLPGKSILTQNNKKDNIEGFPTSVDPNGMYIVDLRKNFIENELTGRYIAFISGTGFSQTRLISSNTATQINFTNRLHDIPISLSQYKIVDNVYRKTYNSSSSNAFQFWYRDTY